MSIMGKSILAGLKEAAAHASGKNTGARVHVPSVDVAAVRQKTALSQREFSDCFAIPLPTLQKWEQGQRQPTGTARLLLMMIDKKPKSVLQIAQTLH